MAIFTQAINEFFEVVLIHVPPPLENSGVLRGSAPKLESQTIVSDLNISTQGVPWKVQPWEVQTHWSKPHDDS